MLHFCMSWTSATSIGTCATHLSRMRSLSEHPRATDLPRSYPGSFRPGRKGLSPIRLFLLLPLDSSNSFLHGLRAPFASRSWRCENSFPQLEVGLFCTVLVQSKSFRCNTYKKQRGYILQAKSFLSANVSCMFRRAPHLSPLFALFGQRVFHNSSAINEFRTLSGIIPFTNHSEAVS